MTKRKKYVVLGIAALTLITTAIITMQIYNSNNKNNNLAVINDVDLSRIDDLLIGSEPPKLLYADKEKVIFNCYGIYVYDMKNKKLASSFDMGNFMSGKYANCFLSCYVLQDGKQLMLNFSKGAEGFVAAYRYSIYNNELTEITKEEYSRDKAQAFECTYLDYQDKLYDKSSGMLANISDKEYVYLTFQDWKVSSITVVHVQEGKETYYPVFD